VRLLGPSLGTGFLAAPSRRYYNAAFGKIHKWLDTAKICRRLEPNTLRREFMKIVYHPRYCEIYSLDPAAEPGRIEAIRDALSGVFEFVEPSAASEQDLLLAHSPAHIASIKREKHLFEIASLSAAGAIRAAEIALEGEPSFGLIRPPGHHASPESCWGFCYFNNIAISLLKLLRQGAVSSAVILDFDLHFGDGTENIFCRSSEVAYLHPEEYTARSFLDRAKGMLEAAGQRDILAVSAGFDRGKADWGDLLAEGDYHELGRIAAEYADRSCKGRRYAVLEGGYNHAVLGRHARAFLEGFK